MPGHQLVELEIVQVERAGRENLIRHAHYQNPLNELPVIAARAEGGDRDGKSD